MSDKFPGSSPFLQSIADYMCVRRYSRRTVKSYIYWIKYFIVHHQMRHPEEMGAAEVEQFLTFLAVERKVSIATQKIALNALAFLYGRFLDRPLGNLGEFNRASRPQNLPVVLGRTEVRQLLNRLTGTPRLVASLLYGSGLRRSEAVRLRIKDVDFDHHQIQVWHGKGYRHRMTTLAPELVPSLSAQIERVQMLLKEDSQHPNYAGVWMPDALARKYSQACRTLAWQYMFPARKLGIDPQSGLLRRHHVDESNINRTIVRAAGEVGISKPVTSHTLRHPPARIGCRHPYRAGAARPPGRQDHRDLHPRFKARCARRTQPAFRFEKCVMDAISAAIIPALVSDGGRNG